jgi:hypothetical protein
MVIEQRNPAIPAVLRLSRGPALATTRLKVGKASLHRPCSANAMAFSAVIADPPEAGGVEGGRAGDCCAGREAVKMPKEHAKQPIAKRTLIIRKFCTLADIQQFDSLRGQTTGCK